MPISLNIPFCSLGAEHETLRNAVREFLRQTLPLHRTSQPETFSAFDPEFSKKLGARGWIGMTLPKKYGGHERSYLERYVVIEELIAAEAPVLAHWIREPEPATLERTAVYGIRVYHNHSRLLNHVDRVQTHAVSAIIQVAQRVERAWELEIFDHDARAHSVVLEPGDMLLYESAACTHGRERPLRGAYYANIFVHFRPRDWLKRIGVE